MAKGKNKARKEARRLKQQPAALFPPEDSKEFVQDACIECLRFPHASWCMVDTSSSVDTPNAPSGSANSS